MTAEVAILNPEAVAIAADSAVTMRTPLGKVYNSANKLFHLSYVQPVAAMIYGSGTLGPIPWETIVKEYRREEPNRSFATVDQYAEDLLSYLSELVPHIPEEMQENYRVHILHRELTRIEKLILDGMTDPEELLRHVETRVSGLEDCLEDASFSAAEAEEQLARETDLDDVILSYLQEIDPSPSLCGQIRRMLLLCLQVATDSPGASGVVVAGFGTAQLFPALSHSVVDGVLDGRVRVRLLQSDAIDPRATSAIIFPFAQADMVATFMTGIHPAYRRILQSTFDELIALMIDDVIDKIPASFEGQELMSFLNKITTTRPILVKKYAESLENMYHKRVTEQIMPVVEALPKQHLAEMAEALVNLASFDQRVTPETETVGGPIDVAVISKGDGLIWIKRKHYFEAGQNPRYFLRDKLSAELAGME